MHIHIDRLYNIIFDRAKYLLCLETLCFAKNFLCVRVTTFWGQCYIVGYIVCTVCRMPVLVCPNCVRENPYPGEYYCTRHRDLKGIYFTVLQDFSEEELKTQRKALQAMLSKCLEKSPKVKTSSEEPVISTGNTPLTTSKNRRRTLRKQINRIDALLSDPKVQAIPLQTGDSQHVEASSQPYSLLEETVDGKKDDLLQHRIALNPKTRSGWGFWRT